MMRLQHGRTSLALHELQSSSGPPLLLLHQLYGGAADWGRSLTWPGSVYALDFSGHGDSDALAGGAYSCELLAADADCALAACGAVALAGAGIGAYVALLLSGARSQHVRAALLLPGRGLDGGADSPEHAPAPALREGAGLPAARPDPLLYLLERDIRPPEYALAFAAHARALVLGADDAKPHRPEAAWWRAIRKSPAATLIDGGVEAGVRELARIAGS